MRGANLHAMQAIHAFVFSAAFFRGQGEEMTLIVIKRSAAPFIINRV
ncbi:hypothetical protein HMPREF1436_01146 [Helicobacter pylori GAMchJs136i]|nr:hypothetical protein HMPREF1436_01146 [Helicobacter pylori GAMchJs136i]